MRKLKIVLAQTGYGAGITPSGGEELGHDLAALAETFAEKAGVEPVSGNYTHFAYKAATLFYLAADAFVLGAQASIGHNRAQRYHGLADGYTMRAEQLMENIKTIIYDKAGVAP